jgi:hypothetical protein
LAKAGKHKSNNIIKVFKTVYLLGFSGLDKVRHQLEEEDWHRSEGVLAG